MRIRIEQSHADVHASFHDIVTTKVSKLETYYDNIIDAVVYLNEEGLDKKVDIKVTVKSDTLFVESKANTFQEALDHAVESMSRSVKKYKEKIISK